MKRNVKAIRKYFDRSDNKDKFYNFLVGYYEPPQKSELTELESLDFEILSTKQIKELQYIAFRVMKYKRHTTLGCRLLDATFSVIRTDKEAEQMKILVIACVRVLREMEQESEKVIINGN